MCCRASGVIHNARRSTNDVSRRSVSGLDLANHAGDLDVFSQKSATKRRSGVDLCLQSGDPSRLCRGAAAVDGAIRFRQVAQTIYRDIGIALRDLAQRAFLVAIAITEEAWLVAGARS